MSFLQGSKNTKVNPKQRLQAALSAIDKVLDSANFNVDTKKALKSLMQTQTEAGENDDLKLGQPQATVSAYESKSGGIVEEIGDMKEKAEETLSGARTTEMKEAHNHDMMVQSLTDALSNLKDKLSIAKSTIASTAQESGKAKEELIETESTMAADKAYLESLTAECKETAESWADRQKSAKEEMAVIEKAKSILSGGVRVLTQVDGHPTAGLCKPRRA